MGGVAKGGAEAVVVVSPSPLFHRRIRRALAPGGHVVEHARDAVEFARHRRQRPFLVCFVDGRGCAGQARLEACRRARSGERFVVVLDSNGGGAEPGEPVFGHLREPFGGAEVQAWARRADVEIRLMQGDRSLEEVLWLRFQAFLHNLGPQGMTDLYPLVMERVERPLIEAVLGHTGGNQSRASEILGIHRNTLRTKIRTLRIDPGGTPARAGGRPGPDPKSRDDGI